MKTVTELAVIQFIEFNVLNFNHLIFYFKMYKAFLKLITELSLEVLSFSRSAFSVQTTTTSSKLLFRYKTNYISSGFEVRQRSKISGFFDRIYFKHCPGGFKELLTKRCT